MNLLAAAFAGFLLGGSLIVAIGAQNAFVLRQGLKRQFVFPISLVCALSDAVLIAAGIAGLGTLVARSETALAVVTIGGALFLFVYGARSFFRALKPEALQAGEGRAERLGPALVACLAFTFLNPHVYLDTVLLIGSLSARYEGTGRIAYGVGAAAASFVWFFALGYGAALLAPVFAKERAWQILDVAIGVVMWAIAARLALSLLG
jgi:L-lysine exporter family protein LysE/ArgO